MPYHTKLPSDLTEVDVIIAGGKSHASSPLPLTHPTNPIHQAASPAASSPAASPKPPPPSPSSSSNKAPTATTSPKSYIQPSTPRNLFPTSKITLFWHGNASEHLAGRRPIVPSGGTLGGGSAMNWMVYTRAQRSDFDSWGSQGWGAEEMVPFLKKLETYHGKGDASLHGSTGPIHISKGTYTCSRSENAFIDSAAAMGYGEVSDLQNLDANNAVERYYRYVGLNGRRQDAAHRYLHPKLQGNEYPNLHVLTEKQVVKVLFEGKKAVGVEYQTNPRFMANPEFLDVGYTSSRTVRARKMVVVSAGANATPGILERSGVGGADVLKKVGVDVVEDLPGVGEDYQDHHLSLWSYRTNLTPRECINGFQDGRFNIDEAIRMNDELLGTNAMDGQGKFRPTEEEVDALGPEFRKAWDRDFKNVPDRPLMILALYNCYYGDHSMLPDDAEYVSQANWTGYPFSRGHTHITGKSMADRPDFETGWLQDPGNNDVKKHVWAYKLSREMWRRMPIFRGELAMTHPRFPEGSKAAVVEKADGPIAKGNERIEYSEEDDRAIEQKVREILSTTWHSLGTCKMAPREKKGVVDERLSVHGLEQLKVADLSIPPENVGANTGGTAFVIGERAAALFCEDLGINQRQDSPVSGN